MVVRWCQGGRKGILKTYQVAHPPRTKGWGNIRTIEKEVNRYVENEAPQWGRA